MRRGLFERGSSFAPVRRDEIHGIDGVLDCIDEIVHALVHFEAYRVHASRLEPGVLLAGPPGTGKTLVARYLATASGALFVAVHDFTCNGSFRSSDVAELFRLAREAHVRQGRPVILFWDEFGCNVRARTGPHFVQGDSEVVSRLAVELDGVDGKTDGVLLVACTNHGGMIDQALLRPGRIGVQIQFAAPDREGKRRLLSHYLSGLECSRDLDLVQLADLLGEHSPASAIEEVVQEAWRLAVGRSIREGMAPVLRQPDLLEVMLGRVSGQVPIHALDEQARLRTAVHEVGHALVALANGLRVTMVSVRPGNDSAGRVLTTPGTDPWSVETVKAHMRTAVGGMAAERLCLGLGVGSGGDTARATNLATRLVEWHGVGTRTGVFNPDGFPVTRPGPGREVSQDTLADIDADVRDLLREAEEAAETTMGAWGAACVLDLAQTLIEHETMLGNDFVECVEAIGAERAA